MGFELPQSSQDIPCEALKAEKQKLQEGEQRPVPTPVRALGEAGPEDETVPADLAPCHMSTAHSFCNIWHLWPGLPSMHPHLYMHIYARYISAH